MCVCSTSPQPTAFSNTLIVPHSFSAPRACADSPKKPARASSVHILDSHPYHHVFSDMILHSNGARYLAQKPNISNKSSQSKMEPF